MRRGLSRFLGVVVAVAAIHLALFHFSAPDEPFLGFPVHHDDFRNLSYRSLGDLPSLTVRPVSTLALGVLSVAGQRTYYLALHLLTVLYVALVLVFGMRVFPSRGGWSWLLALSAVLAALMFEHAPEYALYTGLITNLVSAVTALGALLLLDLEPRGSVRKGSAVVGGVALFAASLLAKEDFAPAVVVALTLRTLERRQSGRLTLAGVLAVGSVLVVLATFLTWTFSAGRTSFLRSPSPFYQPDFTPLSLARTALEYLTCTPGARLATAVQLGVVVVLSVSRSSRLLARSLGWLGVTLALVAPYAALPRHFFPYYALNWIVWQTTSLLGLGPVLVGWTRRSRHLLAAGIAVVLAVWLVATQGRRTSLIRWYQGEAGRNRQITRTLEGLRATLRPWRDVAVVGVTPLNPWFGNDGYYFRSRLGLANHWTVFADDAYLERSRTLLKTLRLGAVEVRPLADLASFDLPTLVLAPDGTGRLALPRGSPPAGYDPDTPVLIAQPARLQVCDGTGLGVTTLEWDSPKPVEVRVGSPDGPVFSGLTASGRAETGKWVRDGTSFYLRERDGRVAAAVEVRVTSDGCR